MGANQSCPCNGDSNVLDFNDEETDAVVIARKVPTSPEAPLNQKGSTSLEKSGPITKGKSRKWAAQPKDGASGVDVSSTNEQVRAACPGRLLS